MKSHVSEGGEVRWPTRVNALQTQERHKKKNVEIIETKKQQKCTNAKIKYHSTQNSKQLQERNPICFGVFFGVRSGLIGTSPPPLSSIIRYKYKLL